MNLAGQNLVRMLIPEEHYLPIYDVMVDRDYRAFALFNSPGHNIGRWWDAMLRLEAATGFQIPGEVESGMLDLLHDFFDNPDHLLLFPMGNDKYDDRIARWHWELHSMREGLLALNERIRQRDDDWARDKAHNMVEKIWRASRPGKSLWDFDVFDRPKRLDLTPGSMNSFDRLTAGRFIEALCMYYQTSGEGLALELAERFARVNLEYSCREDGSFDRESWQQHTHSYLGTLRGLLLFGELSGQQEYIDVVDRTYGVGVQELVRESGYVCHDMDKQTGGDPASLADAACIALWLTRNGRGPYFDDVTRMARSRLLPCQITDCPRLGRMELERSDDGERCRYMNPVSREMREVPAAMIRYPDKLEEIIIGAYGGIHAETHGAKYSTIDVTCSTLQGMTEIYGGVVDDREDEIVVNLHFDYEDGLVAIQATQAETARIEVTRKDARPVRIRVPGWTPAESVKLVVDGELPGTAVPGSYGCVPGDERRGTILLEYALPERKTVEHTDGTDWHFTWRGDEITGIRPNASVLPFYKNG
jgi:hypothetical protein